MDPDFRERGGRGAWDKIFRKGERQVEIITDIDKWYYKKTFVIK